MDATISCASSCSLNVVLFLIAALHSCENIVLWRGHFNSTGNEKSVNLSINGGAGERLAFISSPTFLMSQPAFAASVWLNDVFLKTTYGKYASRCYLSLRR
jgi:hypothetical protein